VKAGSATALSVLLLSFPAVPEVAAQAPEPSTRFTAGAGFMLSEPKEQFGNNVSNGFGGAGTLLYRLDREGWISARFDGGYAGYGRETRTVPFSETVGARILVDVRTTNSISGISIGPEFAVPRGVIRPYANVAVSHLFFRTVSTVEGIRDSDEPIASTTNYSDGARAWVYGAGVRIPIPSRNSRFTLDLGVRYHRGGEASYLREGSIVDNLDGSITIVPLFSQTPFVGYTVGFRYTVPYNNPAPCPRFLC
jgi:hypothetical protein